MRGAPTLPGLLVYVAAKHKLQPHDLKGRDRFAHFVAARREFCWRARHATKATWVRIAAECNLVDHMVAIHHARQYEIHARRAAHGRDHSHAAQAAV